MSKVLSFRDLRLVDELAQYTEFELLSIEMDDIVNFYLSKVGFDTDYAILYVPSKHRDMQGNVGIGYRAVGEVSINRNFINSPLCSTIERLIAASYEDLSCARELATLMGNTINFRAMDGIDDGGDDDFPIELIEPDYESVLSQMKLLEQIRDEIRGPCYNESGSLKVPDEYKEYLEFLNIEKKSLEGQHD